jgi:hypothetical protein
MEPPARRLRMLIRPSAHLRPCMNKDGRLFVPLQVAPPLFRKEAGKTVVYESDSFVWTVGNLAIARNN